MTKFKEMLDALNQGKIIALEEDRKTGEIKFGGAYETDNFAALAYSADNPAQAECLPKVFFVKGVYRLSPNYQL